MAPLPQNNTRRLFVDYEVANVPHSLQLRLGDVAVLTSAINNLAYILDWVKGALPTTWVVTGVRQANQGSNITVPVDYSATDLFGFAGTSGSSFPPVDHPRQLNYVGRSLTTGRRVRLGLYGALITTPANYRLGPGETVFASAEVFAALAAMAGAGQLVTIDGTAPSFNQYVNVNYNSYWETEARS